MTSHSEPRAALTVVEKAELVAQGSVGAFYNTLHQQAIVKESVVATFDYVRSLTIEERLEAVGIAFEKVAPDGVRLFDAD